MLAYPPHFFKTACVSENWTNEELTFCVRAYLWMRECEDAGQKFTKKKIEQALIAEPLHRRTRLDRRYANIAARMRQKGLPLLTGFKPQENVGPNVAPIIDRSIDNYLKGLADSSQRHHCRLDCLVKQIPAEAFKEAADRLSKGEDFKFSSSRDYDVAIGDMLLPPKKLTALASEIWFGAALRSYNFVGAENSEAFKKIRSSGFHIIAKNKQPNINPESEHFRQEVEKRKKQLEKPPKGNKKPKKHATKSEQYERDPSVVAYAERQAKGICQLCLKPAPFKTDKGRPFLEVHHIVPLGEGGEDVIENVAAICPNCHREAHYGGDSAAIRSKLQII